MNIDNHKIKKRLYEAHAEMCHIFTNPKRLEILNLLRSGEQSVGELVILTKLSQSNLSQHLALLRQRGVVKTRREGTAIFYSLSSKKIIKAFDIIREMLLEKMEQEGVFLKKIRSVKEPY